MIDQTLISIKAGVGEMFEGVGTGTGKLLISRLYSCSCPRGGHNIIKDSPGVKKVTAEGGASNGVEHGNNQAGEEIDKINGQTGNSVRESDENESGDESRDGILDGDDGLGRDFDPQNYHDADGDKNNRR